MLTLLEILMVISNIPALIRHILPLKRQSRLIDFMPAVAVFFMVLHLFIDKDVVRFRFMSLYILTMVVFFINIPRMFKGCIKANKSKPKRIIRSVMNLITLSICVMIPTVIIPFHPLPEATGDFSVGTITVNLTDDNRIEYFSKDKDNRKIAVQFWYPTDENIASDYDIENAAVSIKQDKYPLVIFSHGAFGVRMSNLSTFRELASHGYVVASIDHTYHSFYTAFSDGKAVPVNIEFLNNAIGASIGEMPAFETYEITHEWLDLRTADIELVLDSIKKSDLGDKAKYLMSYIDTEKIGLFGHSLGGASSAQVCRNRQDIDAIIVIDGTMIGDNIGINDDGTDIVTNESFPKPIMMMYNSSFLDQEAKETSYLSNINAYNNAKNDAFSLCIKESGHLNFTDLPRISPSLSKQLGVGAVDSYECIRVMNEYCKEFFDRYLKNSESSLLAMQIDNEQLVFEYKVPTN